MFVLTCIFFFAEVAGVFPQSFPLTGTVRDAQKHLPLSGATIRVEGTTAGTVANRDGKYSITLPYGVVNVTASYMGYAPLHTRVAVDSPRTVDFLLTLNPVQLGSTTVYAKNAEAIIRQAIAEKHKTLASLHSYQFDAYTKTTLYADESRTKKKSASLSVSIDGIEGKSTGDSLNVQTILESFSTGYWRTADGLREVVHQRRQTRNIPQEQNLNAVFVLYNFNDDEQKLGKYVLTGPTAPDALDVYNYELLDVTTMFGRKVYRLRMTPKSDVAALWDGVISIADSSWNVVEVDVRPNRVVNFPFFDSLSYRQGFVPTDSLYWMPTNIVANVDISVSLLLLNARLRIEHSSVLSNYIINKPIDDSIFEQRRVVADSGAEKFDSAYWKAHEVMPLTAEEQSAYVEIDSMVRADTVKTPLFSRWLGAFFSLPAIVSRPPFTGFSDVYHFNRVEGDAVGIGVKFPFGELFGSQFVATAKANYGLADHRWKYEGIIEKSIPILKSVFFDLSAADYNKLAYRPDANFYTTGDITLLALLAKNDYRNYFYNHGAHVAVGFHGAEWSSSLAWVADHQTSAHKNSDASILYPSQKFPANDSIQEGLFFGLRCRLHAGREHLEQRTTSAIAFDGQCEVTDKGFTGDHDGTFSYTRTAAVLLAHLRTSSFGFLDARITAGHGTSGLPPQQRFETESRIYEFGPFGVLRGTGSREFYGKQLLSITAQQNLGGGIFQLTGVPYLQYSGMELMLDGAAAWTDENCRQVYFETGLGINKILSLFRIDFTWRLTHRLPSGNFAVTVEGSVF